MKIGIVCPYNMALGGAVQEIVKESYDELTRRGHEVIIITPTPTQGKPDLPYNLLYVDRAKDVHAIGTVAQWSWVSDPKALEQFLDHENFDVLHMHEPWVPFMNARVLKYATCPIVATFHAKLPDGLIAKLITTVGRIYTVPPLKHVHELVAVSGPAAEHVGMITKRSVAIIPNAVNLAEFHAVENPEPLRPGKKAILFVGRFEERKGVRQLIDAYKVFQQGHSDTVLILGGKGAMFEELQKYVADNGINGVEFLGYVNDVDKKDMMRRADLFVAPALYGESFGVILIEALASGQVVVAGDNPGYRSVMKDYGQISLVDARNPTTLAAKMSDLLYDEVVRDEYKSWSKDYVKQFDYPVITDQYEKIYKRLAAYD